MTPTRVTARRSMFAAFALCAAGGATIAAMTVPSSPSATAAPDPCAASQVAKTIGSVANSMGAYLDAHPQTNQALTTISQQQGGPQSLVALKTYMDANPQVAKDLQTLQRPLTDLSGAVQPADHAPTGSRSDAERAAGWWTARRFARIVARRPDRGCARHGFASSVLARFGDRAGHGPAARSLGVATR